jgi:hypothetical protein
MSEIISISPEEQQKRASYYQEYRQLLIDGEQKAQESYDKTVLSLSGGALGIFFAFVKDFIGAKTVNGPSWLLASWVFWGLSMFFVLLSFYASNQAMREGIRKVNSVISGADAKILNESQPGGRFDSLVAYLNFFGGLLFLFGIIAIVVFVGQNLG